MYSREMSIPKIIEYLLRFRPTAQWILNESKLPYLPLELDVPVESIANEWKQIEHRAIFHRASDTYGNIQNTGWKSLTLYGLDSCDTQSTGKDMHWTNIADQCPTTVNWLKDTFVINDATGRIRFMLLEPGGFIVLHKDRDISKLVEINIAITNPTGCIFRFKNYGTVPFKPGVACLMDISNEHFVVNDSTEPRLHIIVHSALKDEKIITDSYANRYYSQ